MSFGQDEQKRIYAYALCPYEMRSIPFENVIFFLSNNWMFCIRLHRVDVVILPLSSAGEGEGEGVRDDGCDINSPCEQVVLSQM